MTINNDNEIWYKLQTLSETGSIWSPSTHESGTSSFWMKYQSKSSALETPLRVAWSSCLSQAGADSPWSSLLQTVFQNRSPGAQQKMSSVLTFNMCLACLRAAALVHCVEWYLPKRMFAFNVEQSQQKNKNKKKQSSDVAGWENIWKLCCRLLSFFLPVLLCFQSTCGQNQPLSCIKDRDRWTNRVCVRNEKQEKEASKLSSQRICWVALSRV